MFEQFDVDIQKQIELLLGQLKSILQEGCDLLERRYGVTKPTTPPLSSVPTTPSRLSLTKSLTPEIPANLTQKKSKNAFLDMLLWSFRDKKRVETIISTFNDQNSRIHEKIKLWCLASQLGVDVEHLRRLQNDDASKQLGFDKDATLRLTKAAETFNLDLELTDPKWDRCLRGIPQTLDQGMFSTFLKDGKVMLQENHLTEGSIIGERSQELEPRTRQRVEALARLLHQPKEQAFRIPSCVGWQFLPDVRSVAFVFDVQPPPQGEPVSLLRLISNTDARPGLGDKFRLAVGLARCISQIHMVQWVHESFRSENILFFPIKTTSGQDEIQYDEPWVLGFAFSRPETFFSNGPADFFPARDIYRHPERQGRPEQRFTKMHDIYALGVVLLEIGLWEPAIKLEKNMFAHASNGYAVRAQLIKHAQRRLEPRVGRKYKDIVVRCLNGNFDIVDDSKEDLKLQQAFRTQVVDILDRAADNV